MKRKEIAKGKTKLSAAAGEVVTAGAPSKACFWGDRVQLRKRSKANNKPKQTAGAALSPSSIRRRTYRFVASFTFFFGCFCRCCSRRSVSPCSGTRAPPRLSSPALRLALASPAPRFLFRRARPFARLVPLPSYCSCLTPARRRRPRPVVKLGRARSGNPLAIQNEEGAKKEEHLLIPAHT